MTYPTFSALASKSDALSLRDVFLKMLMCTRGITGEKALAIQKLWPTPAAFVRAMEEASGAGGDAAAAKKAREELVFRRIGSGGVGRGKVGKAVSAKVGEVWGEV